MKQNQSLMAASHTALARISVFTTFTQDADTRRNRSVPRQQKMDNREHIAHPHIERDRSLKTVTKERVADLFHTLLGAFTMNTHKVKRTVPGALKLISLAAIMVSPLAMNPEPAHAGAYTPSSFDSTCSKIRYARGWDRKPYVYAQCKVSSGWYSKWTSHTPIRGVHAFHGGLRQNLLTGPSTFQNSCRSISVQGDRLTATCSDFSQPRVWTAFGRVYPQRTSTITLAEITNSNGSLRYEDDKIINDTADAIVAHAYEKHKEEFGNPPPNQAQFKATIVDIIRSPETSKVVTRGNDVVAVYWKKGTIVIAQSGSLLNRSTTFKPTKGKAYYDNFK
jgi:hypothetical protein